MIFYQILTALCFVGFLVNIAFLLYLHYFFNVPHNSERYMFLSLFKNMIGCISQLYIIPLECGMAWYMKSFAIAVCFASFFWCLDTLRVSVRKP